MPGVVSPLLFLGLFILFLRTLHPAFQIDDSPETIAACANLSVQHAPGYPLVTLLGRLFAALPVGAPTFRVNLMAAGLGAGCAVVCAALVRSLVSGPAGTAAGVLAGAALSTSRIGWECALSAKGAIYLLNLLLLGLVTLVLLGGGRRTGVPAAAVLGPALGGHWMTAVWWLPVTGFAGRPWSARSAGLAGAVLAIGGSLTLALPLCAAREPSWGDAATWPGLSEILLRRTFLPQAALKPDHLAWLQAADGLFAPLRESGAVWFLAGLGGFGLLWGASRRHALIMLAGPWLTLAAVAALANPVHLPTGELILWLTDRFHLPWLLAVAVGGGVLAAALHRAMPRGRVFVWIVAASLPIAGLVSRAGRMDHAADYLGWDFASNLRAHALAARPAPDRPVTLLAEADYQSFPLLVPLALTADLPEVRVIVTNPFLDRPGGWRKLARTLPEAAGLAAAGPRLTGAPDAAAEARLQPLVDRLRAAGPVLHLPMCSYPALRARLVPAGLLHEVGAATGVARPASVRVPPTARLRWRGVTSERPSRDAAAWSALDVYGLTRAAAAGEAFRAGRLDDVAAACARALPYAGGFGRAHLLTLIGHARARRERYADAEAAFRAAARITPRNLDLQANIATTLAARGEVGEALRRFERVLRRQPRHAGALANLAALRARLVAGAPPPPALQ